MCASSPLLRRRAKHLGELPRDEALDMAPGRYSIAYTIQLTVFFFFSLSALGLAVPVARLSLDRHIPAQRLFNCAVPR